MAKNEIFFVGFLEELKMRKNCSEISWPPTRKAHLNEAIEWKVPENSHQLQFSTAKWKSCISHAKQEIWRHKLLSHLSTLEKNSR